MKNPRHTLYRGERMMEFMHGNTLIILNTPEVTPEESAQAEYDLHMAAWAIIEEAWERGEDI